MRPSGSIDRSFHGHGGGVLLDSVSPGPRQRSRGSWTGCAAFAYVDVSREEAVEHYRSLAAHLEKLGGMPDFIRQEHQRELPAAVRVVADSDPRAWGCPYLWFIARPGKGLLLRLNAVWERDADAVVALARRCGAALGYDDEET